MFPRCAARHLHNLCNSYWEFDTALNSDICTMLIDVSVLACGHLCWCAECGWAFKSIHTHVGVYCREQVTLCAVALACGFLEVRADVVSACGSGFTIFCLMETCINLADSFTVGWRTLSYFYLSCLFVGNFHILRHGVGDNTFPLTLLSFTISSFYY